MKALARSGAARALWASYRAFAANTGVHGLKYITEDGRSPAERVLWLVVALGGLAGAGVMASTFWQRYSTSPTRAFVDTNHYPAWRLPFPAATLCDANRVLRSRAEDLVRSGPLPEGVRSEAEALASLRLLLALLQPLPEERAVGERGVAVLRALLHARNLTAAAAIKQGCDDLLERCKWEGHIVNCSDFFEERKSFIGYCCSFNYRGVKEIDYPNGSRELRPEERPVLRTRYYSHRMGLTVVLNPRTHDYFLSALFSAAVRMLVHGADEYPDEAVLEKALPAGREILLRVAASSASCASAVRALAPSQRRCVFPHERPLALFPVYSPVNCRAECRARLLRRHCNCTPYYFPVPGNTRVCDIDDYICLRKRYYSLHARRAGELRVGGAPDDGQEGEGRQQQRKEDTGEDEDEDTCICPPLCDEVTYDVHFSSGDLRATQFQRSTFFTDLNMTGRILFHFYFGNHVTIRTRRDVISSWNDLLSSLGGVFSLFLGCSFMSLIEMVYFFTLHLALRYRRLAVHAHAYDSDDDDHDHGGGGDGRLKESPLHPALRPLHLQLQLGARPLRPPYGARPHRGS